MHQQFLEKGEILNFALSRIKKKSLNININSSRHIFITGLARSGTTALLQALDSSNNFGSLRYKYMPFILIPKVSNIYSKYLINKKDKIVLRIHGDGIKINANSPECLDEPYWLNTTYKQYDFSKSLTPHKIDKRSAEGYSYLLNQYSKIEQRDNLIIKNNNAHLRILDLSSYLFNSKFLILFRSPIAHAISLLNLHKRLIKIQTENEFLFRYMDMIGHWEFGKGKKPFIYESKQEIQLNEMNDKDVQYWLKQWIFTYNWILNNVCSKKKSNIKLVCYEDLCTDKNYLNSFYESISVNPDKINFQFKLGKSNTFSKDNLDPENLKQANDIYQMLKKESHK